ncbi:MAG TPA: hybrid sensor histidine kinase/response regulator, partial [Acidimicrobiia bacterium]|nr:hybrid sensor histidine kinase/response regulator [Acidimicrobiia bacterium]
IRRLLRRILGDEFDVIEAADGEEAVALARSERPDVVLLDLEMPVLDGHGALLRIRAEAELRTTPVLIVTGAAIGGDDAAACLRDGAHDFVRKPFEEPELLARVRAAYRHKAFEEGLRRRNDELETFASQAAHDLKAPLASIMLITEVLNHPRMQPDDATRRRIQDDIRTLAERGTQLVTDLLAVAREDWTSDLLLATKVDAEVLVWSILDEEKLDEAAVTMAGVWAKVRMPEGELRSVLTNLIQNASHYGRNREGRLDLTITAQPGGGRLAITIADQGPGIDAALAARIFDPFVTATDSLDRNPSSTGLGLAIVKRTLERRGGTAEVSHDHPAGAAFRITVPLAESAV